MWKRVIEGILLFVVGYFSAFVIKKPEELINKKEKMRAIAMQDSFFEDFRQALDCYHVDLAKSDCDDERKLCNDMQALCHQCVNLRYSILVHEIDNNSLKLFKKDVENFLTELEQPDYVKDSKTVLSAINSEQFSTSEKLNQLYTIENLLVYYYLSHIYQNSVIFSHAELLNFAKSDTIQLGEQYVSKLIFSVQDITGNKCFYSKLNDSTYTLQPIDIENSEFKEYPTKKGHYHHDIMLMCSGFYTSSGCEVPIDYHVK